MTTTPSPETLRQKIERVGEVWLDTLPPDEIPVEDEIVLADELEDSVQRLLCNADGSVRVRFTKGTVDNVNRFKSREEGEDFAHRMGEMGFSICIGSDAWVLEDVRENPVGQGRLAA